MAASRMLKYMSDTKSKARIIIVFDDDYSLQNAKDNISDVRQLFMCRNPLDEPWIYIETMDDDSVWNQVDW